MNTARIQRRIGAAVAAVAAVAVTTFGLADGIRPEARGAPPSVRVAYAGLDLSRPEGAQLLYRRLQQAASRVCGRIDRVDVDSYPRWQHCYDAALQRAVLQVNAPELLAVYRSEDGHGSHHG
jgi:UrcA family protein